MRKKRTANTIGLTILPRSKPKRIHNLFRGNNRSGLARVTARNKKATETNIYAGSKLSLK